MNEQSRRGRKWPRMWPGGSPHLPRSCDADPRAGPEGLTPLWGPLGGGAGRPGRGGMEVGRHVPGAVGRVGAWGPRAATSLPCHVALGGSSPAERLSGRTRVGGTLGRRSGLPGRWESAWPCAHPACTRQGGRGGPRAAPPALLCILPASWRGVCAAAGRFASGGQRRHGHPRSTAQRGPDLPARRPAAVFTELHAGDRRGAGQRGRLLHLAAQGAGAPRRHQGPALAWGECGGGAPTPGACSHRLSCPWAPPSCSQRNPGLPARPPHCPAPGVAECSPCPSGVNTRKGPFTPFCFRAGLGVFLHWAPVFPV